MHAHEFRAEIIILEEKEVCANKAVKISVPSGFCYVRLIGLLATINVTPASLHPPVSVVGLQ